MLFATTLMKTLICIPLLVNPYIKEADANLLNDPVTLSDEEWPLPDSPELMVTFKVSRKQCSIEHQYKCSIDDMEYLQLM